MAVDDLIKQKFGALSHASTALSLSDSLAGKQQDKTLFMYRKFSMSLSKSFPYGAAFSSAAFVIASLSCNAFTAADATVKTGTKYKAGKEMQGVLDTLGSLNGKPIEDEKKS